MAGTKKKRVPGAARLKPVAVSDDGTSILLARRAGAKGGFRVAIDDALVTHLEIARARIEVRAEAAKTSRQSETEPPPPPKPAVTSKLSPKEVQVLLRQGRSVTSVAKKAGVEPEWVERFDPPIIWERAGMADRARRATLTRARRGPSGATLGESVEANLRQRAVEIDPDQIRAGWDSTKRARGSVWVVTFSYEHRGRNLRARWEYDPESDELEPLDSLASALGWIEPKRRRRSR